MKIHAIETGTVAIKSRQPDSVGHGTRRQLNTMLDRQWTEPLPIYAFAIEHPEGVIVIDTGETALASDPSYFPRWHPYFRFGVREWVEPEQEIGPQLRGLGIEPRDVSKVVLTHLHTDHAGGLHHFPDSEILVSRSELKLAAGRAGRIRGYLNHRFPTWLDPTPVDLREPAVGPFPSSLALTRTGDVTLVPLGGHTPGQIGVIVQEDDNVVLFGGDSSYAQELMLRGVIDGVAPDEREARLTVERIQTFARSRRTVYLPAHDPGTGPRLERREAVPNP
jgi:N-acyl homoserine lactone hydrolase